MADQSLALAESRVIRGEQLSPLVEALREQARSTGGHIREVDFSGTENEVRIVSLWRDPTALRSFVERTHGLLVGHRDRSGAFPAVERTLWWSAREPGPAEVRGREEHLRTCGPGPAAFTLASPVPAASRAEIAGPSPRRSPGPGRRTPAAAPRGPVPHPSSAGRADCSASPGRVRSATSR
ncbi:hypothetical protein SUDANB121_01795 [Nocardiopsis dassonvillei]